MFSVLLSILAAFCSCMSVLALVNVIRVYRGTRNPFIRGHKRMLIVAELRRLSLMLAVFGTYSAGLWTAAILTKGL